MPLSDADKRDAADLSRAVVRTDRELAAASEVRRLLRWGALGLIASGAAGLVFRSFIHSHLASILALVVVAGMWALLWWWELEKRCRRLSERSRKLLAVRLEKTYPLDFDGSYLEQGLPPDTFMRGSPYANL